MGVVRLRSSIALSLFVHAALAVGWIILFGQEAERQDPKQLVWIEVEPREAEDRQQPESKSRHVVQTEKVAKSEKAAPDAQLGEQTQIVQRQTVSREQKTLQGSKSQKLAKQDTARKSLTPEQLRRLKPLSQFGIALPQTLTAPSERLDVGRAEWTSRESGVPQDYIKGLTEGDRTALNTKEYVFYGYFQRIRKRLDLAWNQALRHELQKFWKSGRNLASDFEHTTKVIVTLNTRGEIVRVQVVEESGTRDLDRAAVEAFNKAGPFPNPPSGLADATGKIEIRWNFVLRS